MRLFTKYILREVTSHALLGGVLFTFVLFTARLGAILEIVVRNSASLLDVARLIAYSLPEALIVTIPMAVLVGILVGLSRLAADSEIIAMRAAGVGALDFVRIVSILSTVALALGLFNTLYLAPHSAAALIRLKNSLVDAQTPFVVQPRVFDEHVPNVVIYVQDVRPGPNAVLWRHVFLANLTEPTSPRITTAQTALVFATPHAPNTPPDPAPLHAVLRDGGEHQISPKDPSQYNISTFTSTDLPLPSVAQDEAHLFRSDTPILALPLPELLRRANPDNAPPAARPAARSTPQSRELYSRPYRIEFNRRFSYPFACLVLMLVGVPLGLSSKRGGKSTGFVLTILLVFAYYFVSSVGVALATSGKISPFLGVWGANLLFALIGSILLVQMSRGGVALSLFSTLGVALAHALARLSPAQHASRKQAPDLSTQLPQRLRSLLHIRFPLILDDYIIRLFASNFALVLGSFSMLFLIFTFFELIGPIIRNRTPLVTVGLYLLNLVPFILYNVTPLCVLVAVLVTFGTLSRSSELTAIKSAGVSLYRVVTPVLLITACIAAGLFAFDDWYLPTANRRQEALLSTIKARPAQTFLRPDRQWISGQANPQASPQASPQPNPQSNAQPNPQSPAEPARIFYYQFFDSDRNVFANLTVFEFDPLTFALQRRVFAAQTKWDPRVNAWLFENGWTRTFSAESVASYTPFVLSTFPEIREQPDYFKKEARQSQEMSFNELSRYITNLRQSGFDTKRLAVQLNKKIAYPLITLVMAILAVPFALSAGKRGGLAGFAIAILLAVLYLGLSSFSEAMGNVGTLPPTLAAWAPDLLFLLAGTYALLRTPT